MFLLLLFEPSGTFVTEFRGVFFFWFRIFYPELFAPKVGNKIRGMEWFGSQGCEVWCLQTLDVHQQFPRVYWTRVPCTLRRCQIISWGLGVGLGWSCWVGSFPGRLEWWIVNLDLIFFKGLKSKANAICKGINHLIYIWNYIDRLLWMYDVSPGIMQHSHMNCDIQWIMSSVALIWKGLNRHRLDVFHGFENVYQRIDIHTYHLDIPKFPAFLSKGEALHPLPPQTHEGESPSYPEIFGSRCGSCRPKVGMDMWKCSWESIQTWEKPP